MSCIDCASGYSFYCEKDPKCGIFLEENISQIVTITNETATATPVVPYQKDQALLKDQQSTGRKRAAKEFPLVKGMTCEWANLKFAGGGVLPVIGCNDNPAASRHHGPDKSTINNAIGNVHRICHICHNRWHTLNDPYYGVRPEFGVEFIPLNEQCLAHDSETIATPDDYVENALFWSGRKVLQATGG